MRFFWDGADVINMVISLCRRQYDPITQEQMRRAIAANQDIRGIDPAVAGRRWANRNSQLPIVGSDGSVWYTDSHYGEGTSSNGIADFEENILPWWEEEVVGHMVGGVPRKFLVYLERLPVSLSSCL